MHELDHLTALVVAPRIAEVAATDVYLAETGRGTVLSAALVTLMTWPVDDRILVLGDHGEELLDHVDADVVVAIDPDWEEGGASALRVGFDMATRADRSDAVVVAALDRPLPDAATVAAVVEAVTVGDRPIAAAKYRYALDYPFVVVREMWDRLLGLEGSGSLQAIVSTHPAWVTEAWFDRLPPVRYRSVEDVVGRR